MDLVKELVERSFGESGSGRGADGRAGSMRNSLADLDEDEPSTPSGSPTRSSPRAAELAGARSSKCESRANCSLRCCCYAAASAALLLCFQSPAMPCNL